MHLTDLAVKSLPVPEKGQKDYRDDLIKGFSVRVSQGGSRVFYLMHGRSRTRTKIGVYPIITLGQARKRAKEILAEKTLGRNSPKDIAFNDALTLFLDNYTSRKPRTIKDTTYILNRHFLPPLRHEKLADITTDHIARIIDRLRSKPTTARHALTAIKMFFSWSIERHYILTSPCQALQAPQKPRPRERVLDTGELKKLLAIAQNTPYPFGPIVLLLILTGQRRSEIGSLKWGYISGDAITLPSELTKNNRPHAIPIGAWTHQVLNTIPRINTTDYLFPPWGDRDQPYSNWSNPKETFDKKCLIEPWTLHDLRRTFSTNMAALGVRQEVTEKLLNHISGGAVSQIARIYNRHTYFEEMAEALAMYENYLATLIQS